MARKYWAKTENLLQRLSSTMRSLKLVDEAEQMALAECDTSTERELVSSVCSDIRRDINWLKDNGHIGDVEPDIPAGALFQQYRTQYLKLSALHARARIEVDRTLENEEYEQILNRLLAQAGGAARTVTLPKSTSSSAIQISQVVDKYCHERVSGGNWQPKSEDENRAIYHIFQECLGDIAFSKISHEQLRDHKDKLKSLPKNHNKKRETRDLPLAEVFGIPDLERISNTTINKHINRLSALFTWAKKQGYCAENYAEGMGIKQTRKVSTERDPFTIDELKWIFGGSIYTANEMKHPYQFWLPLLGLFTGARLAELAQLHLSDIYEKDGVWVIDINKNSPEKKLKNIPSARIVPIHPILITIGFLDFHCNKSKASKLLFNELKAGRDGPGQAASKWFGRYRKTVGITRTDGKKAYHSFRHTFINSLKQLSVPEANVAALAGHQTEGITYSRYGKDLDVTILRETLDQLKFEGLDLEHIRWR